ncbi:MAG TPA: acetyl-coenzyme A synthetase N-terminal domain-containing protein, partial [Gemmatimonadaceae bacterium]
MSDIDVLLQEDRKFAPPESFRRNAVVRDRSLYEQAERDHEQFWAEQAKGLHWFRPWKRVLDWQPPKARWFEGGTLNASYNCIDRHVEGPLRNKAALIWEGEPGDRRTLTYWDLYVEVRKFANVLKRLGVKRGDRVGIYLPMIPEAAIAMLA